MATHAELGRVRFQPGDLDGAEEAFLEARQSGWDPEPGLARASLDRPFQGTPAEHRAPLLAARVEIEVAAGNVVAARDAADELAQVAALFESRAFAASAAMANGRVLLAAGEVPGARSAFQSAVQLWSLVQASHEVALARTGLAHAHLAAGDEVSASLELTAASPAVENLEAGPQAGRPAHTPVWAGPPSPAGARQDGDRDREANSFRRTGDYWFIAFEEHTVALRDLKGLLYLARLLAHPGREFHVLDLVGERG